LPENLDESDVVRCPLCRKEFEGRALVPVIPQVEIVRKKALAAVERERVTIDELHLVRRGSDHSNAFGNSAVVGRKANAGATDLVDPAPAIRESTGENAAATGERPAFERKRYFSHNQLTKGDKTTSSRRHASRRRKKFGLSEFIKIVLGGLLAFPVAQLILWWVFGRDPLQLGKPTSRYLPYAVPAKFRALDESLPRATDESTEPYRKSILDAETVFESIPADGQ
jgi:hypothetical protein